MVVRRTTLNLSKQTWASSQPLLLYIYFLSLQKPFTIVVVRGWGHRFLRTKSIKKASVNIFGRRKQKERKINESEPALIGDPWSSETSGEINMDNEKPYLYREISWKENNTEFKKKEEHWAWATLWKYSCKESYRTDSEVTTKIREEGKQAFSKKKKRRRNFMVLRTRGKIP